MRHTLFLAFFALLFTPALGETPSSWGQDGTSYAFRNAKIQVTPGRVIEKGTLVIKDGKVSAVGKQVAVPTDAVVTDLEGKVVHAGFIDPYVGASRVGLKKKKGGYTTPISGPNKRIHDDFRIADILKLKKDSFDDLRQLGYVAVAVVPEGGIFRGQAAVYTTAPEKRPEKNLVRESAASVLGFDLVSFTKSAEERYPMSAMGHVAAIRQHFLDSQWQVSQSEVFEGSLASLKAVKTGERLLLAEGTSYLEVLRLSKALRDIGVPYTALVLSGQEWRDLPQFRRHISKSQNLILPLKFPKDPKLGPGHHEDQLTPALLLRWFASPGNPAWLEQGGFRFSLTTHRLKSVSDISAALQDALAAGLSEKTAMAALTTEPARLLGISSDFGTLEVGKSASFVIRVGDPLAGGEVEEVWIEGKRYAPPETVLGLGEEDKPPKARSFVRPGSPPEEFYPATYTPPSVLVKGATVWTQGPSGTLRNSDLLIQGGKIQAVGQNLSAPDAHVIQGKGLHVTPGFLDTHSHTAIDGAVNESSLNVTSMVRMKDVLNPYDHNLYLQLGAGLTTANILHGSANAIGGQAITCKWKFRQSPEEMIMDGAPEGIKFALGENPKQSNWAVEQYRYPQSRMGVIESIRGAFVSAKNYRAQKLAGLNPRPDLALEALLEILDGTRIIHCHSYRQDEILALMRLAEEEGFQVKVFQHVLEGYKVADELATHGAGASTFADWWAYKYEVDDAIPHNAALMTERGVLSSVNSDSNDLARRLNTEAAKSIRYGGLSEVQALNLITRNPAQQMAIWDRVGSLEKGKDGDFAVWSAHPLTQEAVCLETWIEGTRYFLRSAEKQRVDKLKAQREKLLKLSQKKAEEKSQ